MFIIETVNWFCSYKMQGFIYIVRRDERGIYPQSFELLIFPLGGSKKIIFPARSWGTEETGWNRCSHFGGTSPPPLNDFDVTKTTCTVKVAFSSACIHLRHSVKSRRGYWSSYDYLKIVIEAASRQSYNCLKIVVQLSQDSRTTVSRYSVCTTISRKL